MPFIAFVLALALALPVWAQNYKTYRIEGWFRAYEVSGEVDEEAPTAPTNLAATAVSDTQINLSWTASTDNVEVTGYRLERCAGAACVDFAEIATPAGITHEDTGLTASTLHRYRVRATDAALNLSDYSTVASDTTDAEPDVTPPDQVTGLAATPASDTQINLVWDASLADDLDHYNVYWCDNTTPTCTPTLQDTSLTNSYSATLLTASTEYIFQVSAVDASDNEGTLSASDTESTQAPPDVTAPVVAMTLTDVVGTDPDFYDDATVPWTATCTDAVGCTSCQLHADGVAVGTADTTIGDGWGNTWTTGYLVDTQDVLKVVCEDAATNAGESATQTVTMDVTDPQIALEEPQTDFYATTVPWVVDALDEGGSGIASVQLILDDVNEGSPDTIAPYEGSIDISLEDDATTTVFKANVCDAVNNCLETPTATVTVDNTDPTGVAITAPADLSTHPKDSTIAITATASDATSGIATVECYYDTTNLISIASTSPYTCEWDTTGLAPGNHTLHVVAIDNAGNDVSSASITVEIETDILLDGLIAHWAMDDGTDTTATDSAGTNDASFVGTPDWVAGHVGTNALDFLSGEYLTVADDDVIDMGTSDWTFSFWFKASSLSATVFLLEKGATAGTGSDATGYSVRLLTDGRIGVRVGDATNGRTDVSSNTLWDIIDGAWHHIMLQVDRTGSTGVTFWIDNGTPEVKGTYAAHNAVDVNSTPALTISKSGHAQTFSLDDVRIYNQFLTSDQRAALFALGGEQAPPASGDYYVSKTGTATDCAGAKEGGTAARATIAAGVSCLSSGDTLIIESGTYAERIVNIVPSGIDDSNHTIVKAQTGHTVVVQPTTDGNVIGTGARSFITFDGLIADGTNLSTAFTMNAYRIDDGAHHIVLQNGVARNLPRGNGVSGHVGSNNVTVQDMTIHDIHDVGGFGALYHGMYFKSSDSVIQDNEFYNVEPGWAMQIYDSQGNAFSNMEIRRNIIRDSDRSIILGSSSANINVYNNIIYNINAVGVRFGGTNNRLYNNTVWDTANSACVRKNSGPEGEFSTAHKEQIKNNIFFTCGGTGSTHVPSGNFTTNPSFVSTGTPDLKLQSGSGACDTAAAFDSVLTTDYDGVSRPQGEAWDHGAYERACP